MLVTGFQFCEFYIWTNFVRLQIILENDEDIQAEIINKAKIFFASTYFYQTLPPSTLQNQIKKMILT